MAAMRGSSSTTSTTCATPRPPAVTASHGRGRGPLVLDVPLVHTPMPFLEDRRHLAPPAAIAGAVSVPSPPHRAPEDDAQGDDREDEEQERRQDPQAEAPGVPGIRVRIWTGRGGGDVLGQTASQPEVV